MALDLWYKEDVARILAGAQEVMTAALGANQASDELQVERYCQGFSDAIRAVAVIFGVAVPTVCRNNGDHEMMNTLDAQQLQGEGMWTIGSHWP